VALVAAGENGLGTLTFEALELSNVDLGDQFNRMIVTQRAYSSAATMFKTVDEMLQVASGLKT
jgi:flagellar hook protein FlgE